MKKVIIACVSVVLVVAIVVGIVFAVNHFKNKDENNTEITNEDSMFLPEDVGDEFYSNYVLFVSTLDDLKEYVADFELKLEQADEYSQDQFLYLNDVSIFGTQLDIYFNLDESGNITSKTVYFVPFEEDYKGQENPTPKSHSGAEMKEETQKIFTVIEDSFITKIEDRFTIILDMKIVDHSDDSFAKVYSGDAILNFTLLDENGYFWNLKSMKAGEITAYELTIDHDAEKYKDQIVNLDVRNEDNA